MSFYSEGRRQCMHQDEFSVFIYSNWKLKDKYIFPGKIIFNHWSSTLQEDASSLRTHTLIWITSRLYMKHLFSINQPFRSRHCPSPFISSFHTLFLPWEDACLFHLLSAPVLSWKLASFSSPSSVTKYSFWTQCQDLLCTAAIFFQCLDKSGGNVVYIFYTVLYLHVLCNPFPMDLPMF